MEQFTARTITPLLLEQEFALVQNNELINQANFSASASLPVREVTASYKRDDIELSCMPPLPSLLRWLAVGLLFLVLPPVDSPLSSLIVDPLCS